MFFRVVIELWKYNIHNFIFYIHILLYIFFESILFGGGIILLTIPDFLFLDEWFDENLRINDILMSIFLWIIEKQKATFEGDIMNVSAWLFLYDET